jgi:hypothetical protein
MMYTTSTHFLTPPVAGADLRAALVASCLRGAFPPVDLRAVCLVRAILIVTVLLTSLVCETIDGLVCCCLFELLLALSVLVQKLHDIQIHEFQYKSYTVSTHSKQGAFPLHRITLLRKRQRNRIHTLLGSLSFGANCLLHTNRIQKGPKQAPLHS